MKWGDRVQEYVRERAEGSLRNLEQTRKECQDRERWKLFCRGHPLVGAGVKINLIELFSCVFSEQNSIVCQERSNILVGYNLKINTTR